MHSESEASFFFFIYYCARLPMLASDESRVTQCKGSLLLLANNFCPERNFYFIFFFFWLNRLLLPLTCIMHPPSPAAAAPSADRIECKSSPLLSFPIFRFPVPINEIFRPKFICSGPTAPVDVRARAISRPVNGPRPPSERASSRRPRGCRCINGKRDCHWQTYYYTPPRDARVKQYDGFARRF